MAVIETRLSTKVERGFSVVPAKRTTASRMRNGSSYRNAEWSQSHRRYTARYGLFTRAMIEELMNAWEAADGPVFSFLFKDWADYRVTSQSLGTAPAGTTAVQLVKTYTFGTGLTARTKTRNITRPVSATVTVYQNGVAKAGTLDATTGLFTPTTSWTEGQALTWTGEFDVVVGFASDEIEFVLPDREISEVNVELEERPNE